ncbi:hypothetical protein H0W26_04105 [Candidatus Dependentiae bacterium]|nr:hypothetical protein [Candidatus Dependentiae bacterium]
MKKLYIVALSLTLCFLGRLEAMDVTLHSITPDADLVDIVHSILTLVKADTVAKTEEILQELDTTDLADTIDNKTMCQAAKMVVSMITPEIKALAKPNVNKALSSVITVRQLDHDQAVQFMQSTQDEVSPLSHDLLHSTPESRPKQSATHTSVEENAKALEKWAIAYLKSNNANRIVLLARIIKEYKKIVSSSETLGFTSAINLDDDSQKECLIQ